MLQTVEERCRELEARVKALEKENDLLAARREPDALALVSELRRANTDLDRQVTERRRVERTLQENLARLVALIDHLQMGVLVEDDSRCIVCANRAFYDMFGIEPTQSLVGMDCTAAAQGAKCLFADPDAFVHGIEERLTAREAAIGEELALADGRVFERDYVPVMVEGQQYGHLWLYRDVTARVRAEETLRASEAKYRVIVESIPMGMHMYQLEPDGRLVFTGANPAADEILGVDHGQFVGQTIEEAFPPLAESEVPDRYRLAASAGEPWHKDQIVYQDQQIAGAFETYAFQTAPGRVTAAFWDVTERQRTEQVLAALYQAALAMEKALTPEGIFAAVAQEFSKLGWSCMILLTDESRSKLSARYLSYEAKALEAVEQLVGLQHESYLIPVEAVDAYRRVVQDKETVFEGNVTEAVRQMLPDHARNLAGQIAGTLGLLRFIAAPLIIEGQVMGVFTAQSGDLSPDDVPTITIFAHQVAAALHRARLFERAQQEIAERVRAEKELRESEEQFRNVFENAPIGIYRTTPDGRILMANPALVRMLGYASFDELAQVNLEGGEYGPSYQRLAFKERIESAGQVTGLEDAWTRKDGSSILIRENAKIVRDGHGNALYYDGTVENITEHRHLEAQLLQAQKMEAVGRLAGGVAHDFNNLLTAIQGYTSLLLDDLAPGDSPDWPPAEEIVENLQEIEQAADRAAALTNQLLVFSRKQVLQPRVHDLNLLVRSIFSMLQRLIGEDIELCTILTPEAVRVKADPSQVEQVIMNLAINARDAMPGGGQLTFETANVVLGEAYAQLHPNVEPGAYAMLSVSDTGIGMTQEVKSHLFEPFFTTKEKGKGTGLGLATVWSIVDQSGGHIEVDSRPGIGTTFKVYLPCAEEKVEAAEGWLSARDLLRGTETVLLVEDEEMVRRLAYRVLERCGYAVLEAREADEALLLGKEHAGTIDLLVTDVVMPGMGGHDLVERIVALRPEIKVLYVSGYTDDTVAHHGVLDPGVAFLQKPFTPLVLAHKVREVLDRS
jgi:two-component system cell cycle sensor histidine kinase/response regulator CckA